MDSTAHLDQVRTLLAGQRLAVLATADANRPSTSIVAFAETPDVRRLYVATLRESRKHRNLARNPEAALLIDNRGNVESDFHQAAAVTAIGRVTVTDDTPAFEGARERFLAKHPYLRDFLDAPTTVLLGMEVAQYIWVDHFQHVVQIDLKP